MCRLKAYLVFFRYRDYPFSSNVLHFGAPVGTRVARHSGGVLFLFIRRDSQCSKT